MRLLTEVPVNKTRYSFFTFYCLLLFSFAASAEQGSHQGAHSKSQQTPVQSKRDPYRLPQALFSIRTISGFRTCKETPDAFYDCLVMHRVRPNVISFYRLIQMDSVYSPGDRITLVKAPLKTVKVSAHGSGELKLILAEKERHGHTFYEIDFTFNPYSIVVKKGTKRSELEVEEGWGDVGIQSLSNGFEGWIPKPAEVWVSRRNSNPESEQDFLRNKAKVQELRLQIQNWIHANNLEPHGVTLGPISQQGYPDNYGGLELTAPGYILIRLRTQFPGMVDGVSLKGQ